MDKIEELVQHLGPCLLKLGLKDYTKRLNEAMNRVRDENFKILLVGEYLRGKSTLLNVLLGTDVLASSITQQPTVNRITYAEQRIAHVGKPGALKEVSFEKLREMPPPVLVDLKWNCEWLKDRIILEEYPSMSDAPDVKLFQEAAAGADIIVMTLASDSLYSRTESDIYNAAIKGNGHKQTLFVANFIDRIPAKDLEEVKQAALIRLPVDQSRIFFLNALEALEQLPVEPESIKGIKQLLLEKAADRAAIKKQRVKSLLKIVIKEALKKADKQESEEAATQEQKDIIKKKLTDRLRAVQNQSNRTQLDLNEFRNENRDLLTAKIENFSREVQRKIDTWVKEADAENITGYLNEQLQSTLKDFHQNELQPFIQEQLKGQKDMLESGMVLYREELQRLYEYLPGELPTATVQLKEAVFSPEFSAFIVESDTGKPKPRFNFDVRRIVEIPEAMVTLVGTIVGGVIFSQFALFIVPVGLGASALLAARKGRVHIEEIDTNDFKTQIKQQIGRIEASIIGKTDAEIEVLQQKVAEFIRTTTKEAQQDVHSELEVLEQKEEDPAKIKMALYKMQREIEVI